MTSTVRIRLTLGFISLAMLVYILLTTKIAILLIRSGKPAHIMFGLGIFMMALVGFWVLYATFREGFTYQRLSRLIAQQNQELDISGLQRKPSGRLDRDAADALFEQIQTEVDNHPKRWQSWYRLGRAYEYAGDPQRARKALRTAAQLHKHPVTCSPSTQA